jgi:hypothetical protein
MGITLLKNTLTMGFTLLKQPQLARAEPYGELSLRSIAPLLICIKISDV